MSLAPVVVAVLERLREAEYRSLMTPLRVAGVEFPFTAALRGSGGRALDLVLIFDTTTGEFGDRDAGRVRQRVEALSRALDVTGSRYVVTAVLAGAPLASGVEAITEICRVLQVDHVTLNEAERAADDQAATRLDDQVRVLLPLMLPPRAVGAEEGGGSAMDQLAGALPKHADAALVERLMMASGEGEEAVTRAIGLAIDAAFVRDGEEEGP